MRGNLEGVKRALNEGSLERKTCTEKLACVKAILPHRKNLALMETLLERLDMDRYEYILEQFYACSENGVVKLYGSSQEFGDFIAFHGACPREQRNTVFSIGTDNFTERCFINMVQLDDLNKTLRKRKEDGTKKDLVEAKKMEEQDKEDETARLKKDRNMQKKKKKGKKKGKSDSGALASETEFGNEKVNEDGNENVRVKAELRRKISELELDEEKSKLALSAAVDEQNTPWLLSEKGL